MKLGSHLQLALATAAIVVTLVLCTAWVVRHIDGNTTAVLQDLEQR